MTDKERYESLRHCRFTPILPETWYILLLVVDLTELKDFIEAE